MKYTLPFLTVLLLVPPAASHAAERRLDISLLNPGELVSPEFINNEGTNRWRRLPYETTTFKGVMLAEGGELSIGDVLIPLKATGKFRIHLGLFSGYYQRPEISVRLSGDSSFQTLSLKQTLPDTTHKLAQNIYEVSWKEADLTGQDLILSGKRDPSSFPVALAFIRLEPIDSISNRAPAKNPPLVVTADGWHIFGKGEPGAQHKRPEDLLQRFEKIPANNGIKMLLWGSGVGDWCNYPTEVGTYFSPGPVQPLRGGAGFVGGQQENIGLWREKGWNSMQVMRDYTRKRGWEFHVYLRLQGFGVLYPRGLQVQSKFFDEHPEFHCRDREGLRVSRLSYAHPEVQAHMLALIREISAYDPEGICLNFIRGLPLALYEPIMVEGFKRQHGTDPRQLPEDDRRWQTYQAEVTTGFVREVRKVLKPGQRISVIVPGNEEDCRKYGADVARWVESRLIDDVIATGTKYNEHDVHLEDADSLEFAYFNRMKGRESVRLMPMLYPWAKFNVDFAGWLRIYDDCAQQGADALAVWDIDIENRYPKVRALEDLEGFKATNRLDFKRIPLKTLQGIGVKRYHYFEGI